MESHSSEKKYDDRMNKDISLEYIRNENAKKILTLRKEKKNKDTILNIRNKLNLLSESKYSIQFCQLKTNNDEIRNFFININNPEESIVKLKYLLNSSDDDELKYGLYSLRKYFQIIASQVNRKEDENNGELCNNINRGITSIYKVSKNGQKEISETEIFISNSIIDILFEIINKNLNKNEIKNFINIYEALWILINMSGFPPFDKNRKFEFYKIFVQNEHFNIFLYLFKDKNIPQEIIYNVLILLGNIAVDDENIKNILINSSLTNILFNYLKTNKTINSDILLKIYRVLYFLYNNCTNNNLSIEAYKIIFRIFSLPLNKFTNKDMINYCLGILSILSTIENKEIENCFNDLSLMESFNDIIFNNNIKGNEISIILILDIFYNIVLKDNFELQKNIVNSGKLLIFFNNLLIKYKKEQITIDSNSEENILNSLNNLILYNHENTLKYILNEGKEILTFFMDRAKSPYSTTRKIGIKSIENILIEKSNLLNIEIIFDMVNIIFDTFKIEEFSNCYLNCIECILLIINKSKEMNFSNDLKNYYIKEGLINYLERIETNLLNKPSLYIKIYQKEYDIENCHNIIDEIKYFLTN